jgi:hypothetical protein
MLARAEELFHQLQNPAAIRALIGRSEDVHFDCKEWPASDGDAQRIIAKASCGLTNAEGGVIVVGMRARSSAKDDPDVVESATPVADTTAVKSRILELIGQLVEPFVEGVVVSEVNEQPESGSGFVLVYVPPSEGSPRRSRKDWKFYQRIGSGTFPMEYFQIEERFGRRPHAKLELHLENAGFDIIVGSRTPARWFVLGLKNVGRGIAKFPSIRYKSGTGLNFNIYGIDGNGNFGLPRHPADRESTIFRGGMDHVVYPDEVLKITKLWQHGSDKGSDGLPYPRVSGTRGEPLTKWVFGALEFECEIACEGIQTTTQQKLIAGESVNWHSL